MTEKLPLVGQQQFVHAIKFMAFGQRKIAAQQIGNGTADKPLPMQTPLAAWIQ